MDFAVGADTSVESVAPVPGAWSWSEPPGREPGAGPSPLGVVLVALACVIQVQCCLLVLRLVGGAGGTSRGVTCQRPQLRHLGRWEARVETEPHGAERGCLLGPPCLVSISTAAGVGSAHLPPWM